MNGLYERINKIILELARCTLLGTELPKCLWDEVVYNATYLIKKMFINMNMLQDTHRDLE